MKHPLIHHFIAIAILLLLSVVQLSSWTDPNVEEHLVLYIIFALIAVVAGYVRPVIPMGFRWLTLIGIFVTACIVADGNDWCLVWLAMLQCLFVIAIVLRRIVMETTGNHIVTSRSVFRALYDWLDEKYLGVAAFVDEKLNRDNTVSLVPLAHATSILSLSFIWLCIAIDGAEFHLENYGYSIIPGLAVAITFFYILKATIKGKSFFKQLLSALVMLVTGFVAMVICSVVAIFSFIAINGIISAISHLFKRLFGE